MRALSSLSTLRTNGYPLILVSGEHEHHPYATSTCLYVGMARFWVELFMRADTRSGSNVASNLQITYEVASCDADSAGARTTTVLQRLPCLPLADAVVTENGGRIFVHDPFLPTAAKFVEDTDWCGVPPPFSDRQW